jgi:hypothetical protein
MPLSRGDRVEISFVESKPELNGRKGTLGDFASDSQRWHVTLDSPDASGAPQVLSFKERNLLWLGPSSHQPPSKNTASATGLQKPSGPLTALEHTFVSVVDASIAPATEAQLRATRHPRMAIPSEPVQAADNRIKQQIPVNAAPPQSASSTTRLQNPSPASNVPQLAWLFPIASAIFAVAVIYYCIEMAKAAGHINPAVRTPPISLAGIHNPEYPYFALGFVAISFAIGVCEVLFWRAASPLLPPPSPALDELGLPWARTMLRLGLLGLSVCGVVPLQGYGGVATLVHVGGSMVFFMCSIQHGFAITKVCWIISRLPLVY